jgi:hypothetical protein
MHIVLKVVEIIFIPQKTVCVLGLDWIPIVQSMTEELGIVLYRFKPSLETASPLSKGYYSSFLLREVL